MGGTVAREKQDLGTGIQCRGVWMRDEATGRYEILLREKVRGERGGWGRKGQERRQKCGHRAGRKPRMDRGTRKPRQERTEIKKKIRTEN